MHRPPYSLLAVWSKGLGNLCSITATLSFMEKPHYEDKWDRGRAEYGGLRRPVLSCRWQHSPRSIHSLWFLSLAGLRGQWTVTAAGVQTCILCTVLVAKLLQITGTKESSALQYLCCGSSPRFSADVVFFPVQNCFTWWRIVRIKPNIPCMDRDSFFYYY